MYKVYALILSQYTEVLKNKIQAIKYWETDIKNQPISILKAIKKLLVIIKTVDTQLHKYLNHLKCGKHQKI